MKIRVFPVVDCCLAFDVLFVQILMYKIKWNKRPFGTRATCV